MTDAFAPITWGFLAAAAVYWTLRYRPPKPRPAPAVAEQRKARFPSGPPRPGTCPICGLDDPDHLPASWRTWPVHEDCLEWLMPGGPSLVDEYSNPHLISGAQRTHALGGVTTREASAALAAMFGTTTAADPPSFDVTILSDPAPVYLTTRPPTVPAAGSPEFRTWFDALPKPAGWDPVQPEDDCDCPYPGQHVAPCIYVRPVPPPGPGAATTAR